jgi:hypothetical protein
MSRMPVLAVALALTAFLPLASPALATAPVGDRNEEVVRDFPGFIDCGSFSLDYHAEILRTISERYDVDGALVRWEAHAHYFESLTNAGTGWSVTDVGARRVIDDYRHMQTIVVGGAHTITYPGHGMVFGEVGRLVFDWNGTPPEDFDDDVLTLIAGIHDDFNGLLSLNVCEIAQ